MADKIFKIGQRIKTFDTDDKSWVYGTVDNVGDLAIEIAWDDLFDTCTHPKEEWDLLIIL